MSVRSKRGALLALVVVSALVLVILGFGLLYMMMQLGGGQELQHATDAGNLNVAKQVLRHPGTRLLNGDELNHFGDSDDVETGEVNLLTFNKLVAQTYLVQANAQALGTAQANQHASQMMELLRGVSNRLNNELINSSNFDQHFGTVAQNHAMRMFETNSNPVFHMGTEHAISLMARGNATNVYVNANQILSGGPALDDSNTVQVSGQPANRRYLRGYMQLASNGGQSLWGVPLRPGLPPHLVSQKNFNSDQPRGPIPSFVPPNAYKSAGKADDKTASAQSTRALAMSLVGCLDSQFAGEIRRGVIVVDNTGSLNGVQFGGGFDIWQDKLMSPNYVEVLGPNANTGLIADQSGGSPTLSDVKGFVNNNYSALASGDATAQSQLSSMLNSAGVDSWGNFTANPSALATNMNFIDFVKNSGVSKCTNGSTSHAQGAPPATTMTSDGGQPCNLDKFISTYGQPGDPGSSGNPVNNLMAVEKYHLDICAERASGSECATITATADNTGLKKYNRNDCGLTQIREGTLRELLQQTGASPNGSNGMVPQLLTYMRQMKPTVGGAELNAVLDSRVAFNRVSYIYLNPSTNSVVLSTNLPPWPLPDLSVPSMNLPDGNPQNYTSGAFSLDNITNCDGECGYPHPWDCPLDSQATGQDTAVWTPSSGFRNILGVIKFRNRANGGGQFCCPC